MALQMNGLTMPADFPAISFEAIYGRLTPLNQRTGHSHFNGAWSAISYRYHGLADYDEQFTSSVRTEGNAPAQPFRYHQERDLFGFFVSAVSIFDAYAFAMHAIGAILMPNNFQLTNERKIDWANMSKLYEKHFIGDPILNVLNTAWSDPAFHDLRTIRHVLAHRAAPPRRFSLFVGSEKPSSAEVMQINLNIDELTTRSRRQQVVRLLTTVLDATQTFVVTRC